MERVRVTELRRALEEVHGVKLTNGQAAKRIFQGLDITQASKEQRLSEWNHGKSLGTCTPERVLRMAKVFRTNNVTDLFEGEAKKAISTPPTP